MLDMDSKPLYTLVFVREGTRILLGLKKRGFAVNKWNGFGGKVEFGETIREAALRELEEECGLVAKNLTYNGLLKYQTVGDPSVVKVYVYVTSEYTGEIQESDEMQPEWYDINNIPFANMLPDDPYWFPYMLRGEQFEGYFLIDKDYNIIEYSLTTLEKVLDKTIV